MNREDGSGGIEEESELPLVSVSCRIEAGGPSREYGRAFYMVVGLKFV